MSISTIYRVSVTVPQGVYEAFGHTGEYERKSIEATKGSSASGENTYSEVEIWAEFDTIGEACQCEARLRGMILYFATKLET